MYRANLYESSCLRCDHTVYPVDRIGPLKDFSCFHSGCFKCKVCGTRLTLKTYLHSQQDQDDKEVYCTSHVPRPGPGHLDGSSVGIRSALSVPKHSSYVNEQIRAGGKGTFDAEALSIRSQIGHQAQQSNGNHTNHTHHQVESSAGRYDASALHIAHALRQTQIQKAYSKTREKPIHVYLDKEEQTCLEMKHRHEEDDLYRRFARQRDEEDNKIKEEIREEWEKELERMTLRYEREMQQRKRRPDEQRVLTLRHQQEREDLEKNMTTRRDRKKETITKKLLEHERAATAAMVEKQSREMMSLITEKRSQFMRAQSLYEDDGEMLAPPEPYPTHPPAPTPPVAAKTTIYTDPIEFSDVDQLAISVAQEDQKTFTDLVRQLIGSSGTDVEKARTIFRWITVKNLNAMTFDEDVRTDTPMGLLRGIKHGTESYHVLFKRLCSYVGLHCVVIKGYSKSAGYQPGVRFSDSRFRNSWNAVYVAGAWRFVQCNWGARHLVNAKEAPKPGARGKSDSLRYEYDDHYFLTEPREFIYEFFPLQPEWQLLRDQITLEEFEELPFVRSLFFRYGLFFPDQNTNAVMHTDATGAATVRIGMPSHLQDSLIFHYNLKLYDGESDAFDGVTLKRFVMQSVSGDVVSFRVHAPCSGSFLLDVFANAVTPREYLTGEPMKFKSVCKFKIECAALATVMVPLPDCASGEWGPAKAQRLFGLLPSSHPEALVFAGREVALRFRMTRPLADFMAALHKNGADERKLARFVSHSVEGGDEVLFRLAFPEEGQYGLDIYTRESNDAQVDDGYVSPPGEKQLLTHCCKYLINSSKRN